jgi:hypothetical protein
MKIKLEYLIVFLLTALYLLNFGLGYIEIIPDNAPLIGNVDEFIASVLLLWSAKKMGVRII